MKHPSSVRSFDFNFEIPSQIFCARNDGHITVWDTDHYLRMDNIAPDAEWQMYAEEESLIGWRDLHRGHSGKQA